jgi:hypothetical protein
MPICPRRRNTWAGAISGACNDGNKAGGHAAILCAVLTNKPAGLDAGDFLMI